MAKPWRGSRERPNYRRTDVALEVCRPIARQSLADHSPPLKTQTPNPWDEVFHLTKDKLDAYNRGRNAHEQSTVHLEALSVVPTIRRDRETAPVVHLLVSQGLCVKLQLKAVWKSGADRADVVVLVDGRWEPLLRWLDTVLATQVAATPVWSRVKSGVTQSPSRAKNRSAKRPRRGREKRVGFLDLPVELQDSILQYACGPQLVTPSHNEGKILLSSGLDRDPNDPTSCHFPRPCIGALYLNRELSLRARKWFLRDGTKVCNSLRSLDWLSSSTQSQITAVLRSVELAFTNEEFLDFFHVPVPDIVRVNYTPLGIDGTNNAEEIDGDDEDADIDNITGEVPPWVHLFITSPSRMRRAFPALHEITLFFPSTIFHRHNPWATNREYGRDDCCQRRLHGYMLPFIARAFWWVPRVRLTGWIKTVVREEWDRLLADRSTDGLAEVKRRRAEVRRECEEAWRNESLREGKFPPSCDCPEDCHAHTVARKPWSARDRSRMIRKYTFDFDDAKPRPVPYWEGWGLPAPREGLGG